MHNDIVIEVIDKIKSGKPILIMQAILTGIEAEITDKTFIEEIENNKENETRLLNVPIGYVATAALDVLGKETYMGSNEYILKMIRDFKNGTIKTEWWIFLLKKYICNRDVESKRMKKWMNIQTLKKGLG